MDEELEQEESVGNIARQPQPLLFPSVKNYGTNQEQSKNTKEAPLDWLTNSSYDGSNVADALDSRSVIDKEVRENELAWKKDLSIHSDEGEETTHHTVESASSYDSEVDILRNQKKKKKRKKQKVHKHKRKHKYEEKYKSEELCHTSKIPKELTSKPDTLWVDDVNFRPDEAFRVSTKPDLDNRIYDTLYRLDVALYKLKPSLTCLGLNRHQIVQLSEQKNKRKQKIQESLRYWNKDGWSCEPETVSVKTERTCNSLNSNNYSYVPLELPEKAPDAVNAQSNDISGGKDTDSSSENSISQRTAEFNKKLHKNPHDVNTWVAFVKFQEEAVLQGEALKVHFSDAKNEQRKKASALVSEKKISIYEKALEHNPNSIELITGHLQLCSEVWSPEKLLQRWKKVIFLHPNKIALWRQYIHFAQSNFSLFSFGKVVNVYQKCLETLSSIKEGEFASHKPEGDIESDMLDLFLQQCHFMRQSGHTEKAFSCFQVLIELSCFCPQNLEKSTPLKEKVEFLETFWDSGVPRFGEDGAVGWKNWMNSSVLNETCSSTLAADLTQVFKATDKSVDVKTEDNERVMLQENLTQWQAWLKVETSRESHHLKPWQPDKEAGETEEDCEDPERLVLFDDVSSSLFNICCLENKFRLVLQFLIFLGVPVPLTNCTASSESIFYLNTCLEDKQQILKMYQGQRLGLWRTCKWTSSLFGNDNNVQSGTHMWQPKHLIESIRNVFAQSLCIFEGNPKSFLMSLWICFEIKLWQRETEPKVKKIMLKDVRKLAKSFLKMPSNRNDLLVWQTYAELEWLAGNVTEARRILDSTLAMSWDIMSQNGSARSTVTSLFRTYAELEIGLIWHESSAHQLKLQSDTNRVLHILTGFAEGEQFQPIGGGEVVAMSPIRILKTQKQFEQLISHVIEDFLNDQSERNSTLPVQGSGQGIGIGSLLVHLVACHALFQYLTSGLKEMCLAFDHVLSAISISKPLPDSTKAIDVELIWTAYVRLLKYHSERHPMPLKDARKIMLAALNWFPENPEFLSFYVSLEARSNVSGSIRRFFDRAIHIAVSPIPGILSVTYEQSRSETVQPVVECSMAMARVQDGAHSDLLHPCSTTLPITGITHRQRSLLDKSSTNPSSQGCVALWRMYIQFEMQYGSQERAKAVFYQALQHCPWAKVLYMDAISYFPGELQSIVDLMEEKEIHVRVPLEELQLLME